MSDLMDDFNRKASKIAFLCVIIYIASLLLLIFIILNAKNSARVYNKHKGADQVEATAWDAFWLDLKVTTK